MKNKNNSKGFTATALVAMIFTTVFGFSNIPTSYMMMGYAAIPWFILAGLLFFIPYALMIAEYGSAFKNEKGGIFVWMSKSVNMKYGFMGMFMWYTAFIVYFVNVSTAFFLKISAFIFGEDVTSTWSLFGLTSTQTIGIYSCIMILIIAFLASKGIKNVSIIAQIGGTAIIVLQFVFVIGALLVFFTHGLRPAQEMNITGFIASPNPDYTALIPMLSFVTMAVSAYGGIEATGGLVDKAESSKKIPKAIIGAAVFLTVAYALLLFCTGMFVNLQDILMEKNINLANVQYVVMNNLGYKIAEGFGGTIAECEFFGRLFTRFYGLANALALLGSITVFFYGPLTQLIEGTPQEVWPSWLLKRDEKTNVPKNAMWVQTAVISFFILLISFGGTSVNGFWNLILLMTNVAMTIPYIFVAGAFPFFKCKEEIEKPVQLIKSKRFAIVLTVIVVSTVGFANVFTIISPALNGDIVSTALQVGGPLAFALIGLLLFTRYQKR